MARAPVARKQLRVVFPGRAGAAQNYSCRDCPARCCHTFGISITGEEAERIAADPLAVARLHDEAPRILARGQLPMREVDGQLRCVFLDDDYLCSLHKRHGQEFLPAACQAFPFGFTKNESGEPIALLSRYCPSISENYGEPIFRSVDARLEMLGSGAVLAEKMGLRSGRVLTTKMYVKVVETWRDLLGASENLAQTLAHLFLLTDAVDHALPADHNPDEREIMAALQTALEATPPALSAKRPSLGARILFAHLLGAICYPLRVMQPQRIRPVQWWERVKSLWVRAQWLFGFGRVSLLLSSDPVPLRRLSGVAAFLDTPTARPLSEFLREVLARRQGMQKKTYLHRVIIELGLMAVTASRYARARAAAEGCMEVKEEHLRDGIAVAELLLTHQGQMGQSLVLDQLRLKLLSNPDDFFALLSAEL